MILKTFSGFLKTSIATGIVAAALAACSTGSVLNDVFGGGEPSNADIGDALSPDLAASDDKQVAGLYNEGLSQLNKGNYKTAAAKFADVERRHPYSKWATKSLLMQGFSHYQRKSFDDAINSCKRFIALHPGHKDTPYAYYLVGLSEYEQIGIIARDQSQTEKALDAMEEVSRRFPESQYAVDAQKKVLIARDHLAAKEMEIGRYYLNKGSHLAAVNRFKRVVTDYQTTSHTPEALYRLSESYMAMGVVSEAQTAAAVLGHNFPKSTWYRDAYALVSSGGQNPVENQSSWISRAFRRVTG
jgi:outer membrane protein assembly factor BamD